MSLTLGAFKVGIATTATLAGGPPSANLAYVLPTAKSAVCFAVAFDQSLIDPYFKKEDHKVLETNKVRTTTLANGIALEIAEFLQQQGYQAVPKGANFACHPDPEVRKARYRMLMESGVIIQEADGTRRAVSPEEAKKYLESMPPDRRKLYDTASAG